MAGRTFADSEDGISALCAALACFEVEVVPIERRDGLVVDRRLDAGVQVLALHPNQITAARDRSGPRAPSQIGLIGSLCQLAPLDRHRFRVLEVESDATKALRALTWELARRRSARV